jgi:hypothetical protein
VRDSRPGWVASPFLYGSFIRYSLPDLAGAFPDRVVLAQILEILIHEKVENESLDAMLAVLYAVGVRAGRGSLDR